MPETLDVFKGDGFSSASLTASMNAMPHRPGRIGQLGVFGPPRGIATTVAWIEERSGTLKLIANQPRGGPANLHNQTKRTARAVAIPHLPLEDQVLAADVQNIRQFGSDSQLEGVVTVVNDHLQEMLWNHEATQEHLRIGALHGKVLDSDGSTVLVDLFNMFGVAEQTVDFNFGVDDIRTKIQTVVRLIENELGGIMFGSVHFICGDNWWDTFMGDADLATKFARWEQGAALRDDLRFRGFEFAGATFENYRGSVGGTAFVNTDQARAFPIGVPMIYRELYAPADFVETANTIGLQFYAKQKTLDYDRGIGIHTQSNPLPICLKPKALIKITKS